MIKKIIKRLYGSDNSMDSTSQSSSDESYVIKVESSSEHNSDNSERNSDNSEHNSDDDDIEKISGDSSSKIIYRQRHDRRSYGVSSSVIIDFSRLGDISDEYLHVSDVYDTSQYEFYREINTFLYMKVPHCIGCRVAEIYGASDYAKSLQMEDLGYVNLVDIGFKFTVYRDLIRWLAHLDKLYRNKNVQYHIKYRKYETEAINDELSDFIQYCGDDYMEMIEDILIKVSMVPKSICHRDFQPRNIMIHDGQPRVIDVQDMCIGPMTYDLGSLLYDPFVVVSKSDIHVLTTLYSFITNRDTVKIQKWTKLCGKIRLMKMAGRHAKIYSETKNEDNKLRSEMAIKRLLSI